MNASDLWQALDWAAAGFYPRLTPALVHFLWQGCAVAALYAVAARLLQPAAANARYLAGVAAMLLMAVCLPATLLVCHPTKPSAVEAASRLETASTPDATVASERIDGDARDMESAAFEPAAATRPPDAGETVRTSSPSPQPAATGRVAAIMAWASPCTSVFYLCGVVVMLSRVALGLWGGRRLQRECMPVTYAPVLDLVRSHARSMAMRAVPLIASCRRVGVPVVVGVLRPMILLPAGLVSGLTLAQLEAVLVHELAHIRRFDPAVNVLQRLVEAMLFFHPAVWWVSRCVSGERENACDDLALLTNCGRDAYARALLRMAELCVAGGNRAIIESSAPAATGRNASQFKRRVLRLLDHDDKPPVRLSAAGVAISLLLVLSLLLVPAVWRNAARAEEKPDPAARKAARAEDITPVSMSAEEFSRLSAAEQRALLVRVFQRRLEHAKNLYYETEQTIKPYENRDGEPGKLLNIYPGARSRYRHWRLGDSFRMDVDRYRNIKDAEPWTCHSTGVNAEEGLGRNKTVYKDGTRPPYGQVQYPFDSPGDCFQLWLNQNRFRRSEALGEHIFPYLLDHKDDFEIEAPTAGEMVRLTVPWQPRWADKPRGKCECLLDPGKGFLPVRCDLHYEDPFTKEHRQWRIEKTVVEKSRLVGDVWMPVKLKFKIACSSKPELMNVYDIKALQIEHGKVTPADLTVPFTEGMEVIDTVMGVRYVADAQGNPAGPVEIARGWNSKPPEGCAKREFSDPPVAAWSSRLTPADMEMLRLDKEEKEARRQFMESNVNLLQADPPAALDERIEAALKILRAYKIGENEAAWATAIRKLIEIGKPAVPRLIEELDRTEREETLRALGFVLRGIGDPRSLPALIRAIPRIPQPPRSDFGLRIDDDPELAGFMARYDHESGNDDGKSGYFSFGRPIYEIMPALEKMTGESHGWKELRFAQLKGGMKQRRIKKEVFLKLAQRWADWWSENWRRYVKDADEAQLDLIEQSLDRSSQSIPQDSNRPIGSGFPRGANATVGEESYDWLIKSFKEWPEQGFLDLDSGRLPCPPPELVKASAEDKPSKELLAWAGQEGVDLITIKVKPPGGGKSYYAFEPLGMKVRRIENGRYDNMQEELRRNGKLELPKPWRGPLAQIDEKSGAHDEKLTASFLFITKEGVCGALQIRPPLGRTQARYACLSGDGGLHYKFTYEEPPEQ